MNRRILSFFISMGVVITTVMSPFSMIHAYADDENAAVLPEPVKVVDFSYSYDELKESDSAFSVVENAASPVLIEDEEMGQVLQLKQAVIKDYSYAEDNNYWRIDNSEYSTIKLSNPYVGREYLKEYDEPYDTVKTVEREDALRTKKTIIQPEWEEGITISYWIKSPSGKNSNVVGFTNERFQIERYDYPNYLNTVRFDKEYNQLSDEDRQMLGIGPSGVLSDSVFYFDYAGYDEEGNPLTHEGKPVYISPEKMGDLYYFNKFYEAGYYIDENGEYLETNRNDIAYEWYSTAPYLGTTEDDHDPGLSNLRYAWTYGEMWLDASSSFYFTNDATYSIQLNPNHSTSYGTLIETQHGNRFYINSWKSNKTFEEAFAKDMAADSPLTEPGEWHYVTVVIQNDWVSYYLDGEFIDVKEEYSSSGMNSLETLQGSYIPWKLFNKGAGARYGYGILNNKPIKSTYLKYVAPTMMEWLVMECTEMTIGGGNLYGDNYYMFADTDEILIKNVVFYDTMLTDEQIKLLAGKPLMYDKESGEYYGDVNVDGDVTAEDALLTLKNASRLISLSESQLLRSDVNSNSNTNAEDALLILKYAAGIVENFE